MSNPNNPNNPKPSIRLNINLPLPSTRSNISKAAAARGETYQKLGIISGKPSISTAYDSVTPYNEKAAKKTANNLAKEVVADFRPSTPTGQSTVPRNNGTGGTGETKSLNVSANYSSGNLSPVGLGEFNVHKSNMFRRPPPINRSPKNLLKKMVEESIITEELLEDKEAFGKAIADLIAYEPNAEGWAEVKFLVQVDTDVSDRHEESFHIMSGGTIENARRAALRAELKREDYVSKTYNFGMDLANNYNISRDKFETSKAVTQCKIAGVDTRNPCWMCGFGTNLFFNARREDIDGDVIFKICDAINNQYQCEHILPAGLMAILDYLANKTYPSEDEEMRNALYDVSCRMCNMIKSNNIYIKNVPGAGGAIHFAPDHDELMKDVVMFFQAVHGTNKADKKCDDGVIALKGTKKGEGFYCTSVVTNSTNNVKYPNLIWAKLHKDLPTPPAILKRALSGNAVPPGFGQLKDILLDIEKARDITLVLSNKDYRGMFELPAQIMTNIHVPTSVEWIRARFNVMKLRIERICTMLNLERRKRHWAECVRKMREDTTPPNFIKRVVYETKADLDAATQIAEEAEAEAVTIAAQRAAANIERAKRLERRSRIASKIVVEETKNVIDIENAPSTRTIPVDANAIRLAKESARERIDDEIDTREWTETFLEMRARTEREERAAFPRRYGIGPQPPPPPLNCKSNNNKDKPQCSIQGGRYISSRKPRKPHKTRKTRKPRKTRKLRKSSKKNTRRK